MWLHILVVNLVITASTSTQQRQLLQFSNDPSLDLKVQARYNFEQTVSAGGLDIVDVQITLRAPPVAAFVPIALTTALDKSLQVVQNENLQNTLQFIGSNLQDHDLLGLITYDSQVDQIIELQSASQAQAALNSVIETPLQLEQGTIYTGVEAGFQQQISFLPSASKQVAPGIVVLSGEKANVGMDIESAKSNILTLLGGYEANIGFYCLAYGDEGFSFELQKFVEGLGGNLIRISSPNHILEGFGTIVGGLLTSYFNDVNVQFFPSSDTFEILEVSSGGKDLLRDASGGVSLSYNSILAEERRDIICKIKVKQGVANENALNIKVSAKSPLTGNVESSADFSVKIDGSLPELRNDPTVAIQQQSFELSQNIQSSTEALQQGNFDKATQELESAQAQVNTLKSGGVQELLQSNSIPQAQSLEFQSGRRRLSFIQQGGGASLQEDNLYALELLNTFDVILQDAFSIVNSYISNPWEADSAAKLEILREVGKTLGGETSIVLNDAQFQSTVLLNNVYRNSIQNSLAAGIDIVEREEYKYEDDEDDDDDDDDYDGDFYQKNYSWEDYDDDCEYEHDDD
eukprot:TRINITY_DN625_c0_g4_i2.p1 TRINITY_DN625_c0_g4~~TRINITY_DN625_c0_g4_i2.p1  ORF type:complete len:575 (-),score=69.78 TRINITY_DN625_c0_g4_i2:2751-4475(-)